jgi:hypothetical protein
LALAAHGNSRRGRPHYARYSEALAAMKFVARMGWIPPIDEVIWAWEDVPRFVDEYARGDLGSLFPIYAMNAFAFDGSNS